MSQLARHPAYLLIEDQLDAIGQKYRAMRILRGAALWVTLALATSVLTALGAHFAGAGAVASTIFAAWLAVLVGSFAWWILRPLLFRPRAVEVARLVETRVDGLHNGLTNSVLLAQAADLQDSPWLGAIYEEILGTLRDKPVNAAVALRDLRNDFVRLAIAVILVGVLLGIGPVRGSMFQGFRQMLAPTKFVPKLGKVVLVEVQPKEITLVTGQPLEITVLAEDPDKGEPMGKLVFEKGLLPAADLTPSPNDIGQLRYQYRVDRVEQPMRWRVEVGGTQSEWCVVNVVKQVKLQELILTITPPPYAKAAAQTLAMKADEIDKMPIAVLEGSRVELSAVVDVPVKSALLQLDQETPIPMRTAQENRRFTESFIVMQNAEVSVLLTEAGQVVAKLPDPALRIGCTKDAPPAIEMKWPSQDTAVAPKAELKIHAILKDDQGVGSARVMLSTSPDQPLAMAHERAFAEMPKVGELTFTLEVPDSVRVHGQSVRVQIEASDNRNLAALANTGLGSPSSARDAGPQSTASPIYEIKFRDPEEIAKEQKEQADRLRLILVEMIKKQQGLLTLASGWKPNDTTMPRIQAGQVELRQMMQTTAQTFPFEPDDRLVQKTLLVLYQNPAREAVDLALGIQVEKLEVEQVRFNNDLQAKQRRIIEVLETLLSRLNNATAPTSQPSKLGGDLDNQREKMKELAEDLKKFIAEEKRILDASAHLAKKPVDNFDDADKKLLEELKMAQEKLDAFMQEKISDFSKLAEQDMANASLLKELLEVYSEVTMAKDALKKQAVDMSIPLEEMGVELAKEITSNLEKWLMDKPDREKWNQEDPLGKTDVPMAELPTELEDMVGELMEQQEDLFEEMEDTAANWADSLDKGAGWDAADGPIANMSAKGVTGNQLPNNNEMNGRSGEGRSGKSTGEFVEETASGKGGRNTPTRLDPTPYQQGQVKDESKDPVGGATGGGKMSGQGGAGLEGPVPPKDMRDKMERLATKQAELRNKGERIALDPKLGSYDNFKLLEAVALMRRVESDIKANRYQTAMRRKDVMLDKMEASHLLLSGKIHTQRDTSPTMSDKMEDQINDVLNGDLPAAWSEALKEYYKKLAEQ